jgi:hypothetical protein
VNQWLGIKNRATITASAERREMALSVIITLYISIGLMSAAGSVALSQKVFSAKAEQIFFGLFLVPIAGFYLAFTAHFGNEGAWRLEAGAVAVCAVLGVLGSRVPGVLMLGYVLHGLWDLLHELHAHAGVNFDTSPVTEIPLAYGAFCATYDWCLAVYFYTRRRQWRAAWGAQRRCRQRPHASV